VNRPGSTSGCNRNMHLTMTSLNMRPRRLGVE
jgi:hypothetical protein